MVKEWLKSISEKKFKNYTHFDTNKPIKDSQEDLSAFESFLNPKNIIKRNFWPLIRYEIKEKKFIRFEDEIPDNNYFHDTARENENEDFFWHKKKIRPISYASHYDSYIYSYYSFMLSEKYEEFLNSKSLENNVLAYRRVFIDDNPNKWKNNIHFSMDVFQDIIDLKDCIVFAFDIKGFFDSLDHSVLKKELKSVMIEDSLSEDWFKVYKSLTNFSYIKKEDLIINNLIKRKDNDNPHIKVIDVKKFNLLNRETKKLWNKLVQINSEDVWIPQWTPISGVLANVYMASCDLSIRKEVYLLWGKYYRYSDDILLIIPVKSTDDNNKVIENIYDIVNENISKKWKMRLNVDKTEISIFSNWNVSKTINYNKKTKSLLPREKWTLPLQYLWFTFDWKRILIRDKTFTNYYKKLILSLKRLYHLHDTKKDENWIESNNIKWDRILLWKFNRKYLYNWSKFWKKYVKYWTGWRKVEGNNHYLWFLAYWYRSVELFNPFCEDNWIKNWIKKQLSKHKKIYQHYLEKFKLK